MTWKSGRVARWLVTVDHKRIGILYIATSLFFFVLGGILARAHARAARDAERAILTKNSYNEMFTMHGTTMIFLVVVPILAGFGNYLVPLMIGARDMAFPRLNALSYWLFLLGGIVLSCSLFATGGAAQAGWWSYPPLSRRPVQPRPRPGLWILALHILTLSSLTGAINFIVTIAQHARAGHDLDAHAALRLGDARRTRSCCSSRCPRVGGGDAAPARPPPGTHFFIPTHGGSVRPLAAHVLVLRAPRGLHHDPARRSG